MSEPFIGEIIMFGGDFAPAGWALCDGQIINVSDNEELFSIIGAIYGGNGRTTFGLPDLRGRAPMSFGQGAGLSNYLQGSQGGVEQVALATTQIPSHKHAVGGLTATPNLYTRGSSDDATGDDPTGSVLAVSNQNIYHGTVDAPMAEGTVDGTISMGGNVANKGAGRAHENRQPYQTINFIIALIGQLPTQT